VHGKTVALMRAWALMEFAYGDGMSGQPGKWPKRSIYSWYKPNFSDGPKAGARG
jgi:hypothetical protein